MHTKKNNKYNPDQNSQFEQFYFIWLVRFLSTSVENSGKAVVVYIFLQFWFHVIANVEPLLKYALIISGHCTKIVDRLLRSSLYLLCIALCSRHTFRFLSMIYRPRKTHSRHCILIKPCTKTTKRRDSRKERQRRLKNCSKRKQWKCWRIFKILAKCNQPYPTTP